MVFRTKLWTIASYKVWGVPLSFIYGTRSGKLLLEKPGQRFLQRIMLRLFAPMVWFSFNSLDFLKHISWIRVNVIC